MTKRFSISILISGNLQKTIRNVTQNINAINNDKHVSIPHINILSGLYSDETKIIKMFKKIKFEKKNLIKSLGIGVFAGKKNVIYLRFELNKFIIKLRKHVFNTIKLKNKEIDLTARELLWTPKCTLAILKANNKKFLPILNLVKKRLSKGNFYTKQLALMDVTSSHEIVLKKK